MVMLKSPEIFRLRKEIEIIQNVSYRQDVVELIYLMLGIPPDLVYSFRNLSRVFLRKMLQKSRRFFDILLKHLTWESPINENTKSLF